MAKDEARDERAVTIAVLVGAAALVLVLLGTLVGRLIAAL